MTLPTLHDLMTAPTPPTPEQFAQTAKAWRTERVRVFDALTRTLNSGQRDQLLRLLQLASEEGALGGASQGYQAGRRVSKTKGQLEQEDNLKRAQARAIAKAENTTMSNLLKKAADDNAALRARADTAEKELAALRAALPAVERVVRQKIIAAAPADHRPLPRMKPRSGVFSRYLSHTVQIRRVAQRIEEFIAGPECRGFCTREKLAENLLPESPAAVYQPAITHLLLSGRLKESPGGYRLRNPKGERYAD